MLTQLSRSVLSSSTIRMWRLDLVSGVSERGSGGAVAGPPGATGVRIAVMPTSRPDTFLPAQKGGPGTLVTRRVARWCDAGIGPIRWPPRRRSGTRFTVLLVGCQDALLLGCNSRFSKQVTVSHNRDNATLSQCRYPDRAASLGSAGNARIQWPAGSAWDWRRAAAARSTVAAASAGRVRESA